MNCSNCNVANFVSGVNESEEIMCENGHFLCRKCYASSKTKCIQCGGRLYDCIENIPLTQHYTNWTLDMICDWMKMNEKTSSYSRDDNFVGEFDTLRNGESMNMLFSRSKSFDGESEDNSNNDFNILNSKGNQTVNQKSIDFVDQKDSYSKYVEHSQPMENNLDLVKKDTRQNLVDQMQNEIRGKIKEEICNLFKNDPRTLIKPDEYMRVKESKTIGVSTESEPNILPRLQSSKERIVEVIDLKPKKYIETPQGYSVMNINTKQRISPEMWEQFSGKKSSTGREEQFQKVIETVLDSGVNTMSSDETADKYFFKMLKEKFSKMPQNKLEQIISSICDADESQISDEIQEQPKSDFLLISNSSRASYCPTSCHQILPTAPKPQFQFIKTGTKPAAETVDATTLHIPRSPVICPITSCQQACFVSDFTRHIAVDHTNVPMERIIPRQCKHFFLDPKLIHFGSNRCQMLLLIKDKIRNLGHEKKFKDFIPVLVMSTKISTSELCCKKSQARNAVTKITDGSGLLMIWLTGLMPPQLPIYFSMTVWARTGNMPSCHIVHSGQLYSIRNSQSAREIQESGQRLLLSRNQVELLTNNGRNMLELQIVIN